MLELFSIETRLQILCEAQSHLFLNKGTLAKSCSKNDANASTRDYNIFPHYFEISTPNSSAYWCYDLLWSCSWKLHYHRAYYQFPNHNA